MIIGTDVRLAVVGCGNRGSTYAVLASRHADVTVTALADHDRDRRRALAERLGAGLATYAGGAELLAARPPADLVVVATPDHDHCTTAVAALDAGYDILLEKPMAATEEQARAIRDAAVRTGRHVVVAHVLRYQPYSQAIYAALDAALIGEVVSVDHVEPIGSHHFAHSYVRGNWAVEGRSSSALMSKSCHDIDWLVSVVRSPVRRVSSFGSLTHFRPENAPAGSSDRCLTCRVEDACPYSAVRYYQGVDDDERWRWPISVLTPTRTAEAVDEAVRTGPYGRCVYRSDNDVVDHQVVTLEFATGATAAFTMSAFTPQRGRSTRIGGTRGYLEGDGEHLKHTDFRTGNTQPIALPDAVSAPGLLGQHAGGDAGLVDAVLDAIRHNTWSDLPTDAQTSYDTHAIVWAAERARHTGEVVTIG